MYIDTSCLGSYYIDEIHSKKVQSILLSDDFPVISSLTEVEFHSMLNKKLRMKQISGDQQKRIIDTFNGHLRAQLFEMLPLSDTVFHTARWVLSKTEAPLRTLDSLHLAFSITNRLTLFSTDSVLLDAALDLKVDVISGI
jgi:uncharacterized protein with PIN domain